ncbi:MAG: hypothetical protein JZU63_06070 [Rhodoferax sp.]|nr:hypothetical protein [Rhodoferax sp.]
MCSDPSERNDGETDQVRRLLAFLEPVMGLQTQEERCEKYQETWARLNPAVAKEVWKPNMAVNFPWSRGKVELWRTLRSNIETQFQTALSEHLNGEFTHKPIVPFSFMHYSDMLLELLDKFLKGLDKYIAIQDRISAVSKNMDAYCEDERPMSEKSMHASARRRAQDFLDVILFLHAVPQRADGWWDALDHEFDVTWFREHCGVYQKDEDLMAFLRDCAVVVLLTGCFSLTAEVKSIHDCYVQLERGV